MEVTKDMRERVLSAYAGEGWRKKVEAMTDSQLIQVYKRFLRCGRLKVTR